MRRSLSVTEGKTLPARALFPVMDKKEKLYLTFKAQVPFPGLG